MVCAQFAQRKFQKTTKLDGYLKPELEALLPEWKGPMGGALGLHLISEVQLAASLININGVEIDTPLHAAGSGEDVNLVAEEEQENNWAGQVSDEEGLDVKIWSSDWLEGLLVVVLETKDM